MRAAVMASAMCRNVFTVFFIVWLCVLILKLHEFGLHVFLQLMAIRRK